MITTNLKITLIMSVMLFLTACFKKDPEPADKIPELTTEGKMTFGCRVNGNVWVPKVVCTSLFPGCPEKISADRYNFDTVDAFYTVARRSFNSVNERIDFTFHFPKNDGSYNLVSLGFGNSIFYSGKDYSLDLNRSSVTVIKIDTVNKIISGRFQFSSQNDSMKITDGVFDFKYIR